MTHADLSTPGRTPRELHPAQYRYSLVKELMIRAGLNQTSLREALKRNGVNPNVGKIVRGEKNPSAGTAAIIATLFGVPLDEFYEVTIAEPLPEIENAVDES